MSRCILNTYLRTMCLKLSALYKHFIHNTYRNKGCGREDNIAQGKSSAVQASRPQPELYNAQSLRYLLGRNSQDNYANSQLKEKSRDLLILPHISEMVAFSETDSLSVEERTTAVIIEMATLMQTHAQGVAY